MRGAVLAMSVCALVSAQVEVTGPWQVTVKGGGTLAVPPQTAVEIRGEAHKLPVFRPTGGGWTKGAKLSRLVTQECTAAGALVPASLKVKAPDGTEYARGTDWEADDLWGTVGRVEGGKIPADQAVSVDYDYYPNRMCLVAVDAAGKARLVVGEPGVGIQLPPALAAGEQHVATVWLSGEVKELTEANVLPVDGTPEPPSEWIGSAETLCPKTLAKLRAGEPVTIVAWGDSVTNGGGVRSGQDNWYQYVFLKRLRERFPKSEITLHTASWPGGNSRGYMSAPAGGKYDFQRDVLDPKPDLVTIEFVNDAGWKGDGLKQHYTKIREILQGNGSEIILITPHFVRPDWMGVTGTKFDDDPRPYVQDLREFARENQLPVADASRFWGHLWREGTPYMTLEGNSINHPDERGHRLFADALMEVFPAK